MQITVAMRASERERERERELPLAPCQRCVWSACLPCGDPRGHRCAPAAAGDAALSQQTPKSAAIAVRTRLMIRPGGAKRSTKSCHACIHYHGCGGISGHVFVAWVSSAASGVGAVSAALLLSVSWASRSDHDALKYPLSTSLGLQLDSRYIYAIEKPCRPSYGM